MATQTDLQNFVDACVMQLDSMKAQCEQEPWLRADLGCKMAQIRAELHSAQYKLDHGLFAVLDYQRRDLFIADVLNARQLDRLAEESAWQDRYDDGFTSL